MSRVCEVTRKKFGKGRSYQYRGIAKKNKGIGLNITGSSKRQHRPNLFVQKFWSPLKKQFIKLKVSAHAIRIIDRVGIDEVVRRMQER
ncbi:MAG: 50S ribosomal protein L28 [Chlamydiae bacterium RIFCSPHIGHO2_12_FULL_49_11]|nr:MAG: 50S ribosomal protein L28 [Chlamydiae bacterium RIFCSPHIGHO2_12_FULL_49_11]